MNGGSSIHVLFESFVNSEEYQTVVCDSLPANEFESFVNSEEYQTACTSDCARAAFESFVNSEEYQTIL